MARHRGNVAVHPGACRTPTCTPAQVARQLTCDNRIPLPYLPSRAASVPLSGRLRPTGRSSRECQGDSPHSAPLPTESVAGLDAPLATRPRCRSFLHVARSPGPPRPARAAQHSAADHPGVPIVAACTAAFPVLPPKRLFLGPDSRATTGRRARPPVGWGARCPLLVLGMAADEVNGHQPPADQILLQGHSRRGTIRLSASRLLQYCRSTSDPGPSSLGLLARPHPSCVCSTTGPGDASTCPRGPGAARRMRRPCPGTVTSGCELHCSVGEAGGHPPQAFQITRIATEEGQACGPSPTRPFQQKLIH